MSEKEALTTVEIENKLDEICELIGDESRLNYNEYNLHRRIVKRCEEIINFFD